MFGVSSMTATLRKVAVKKPGPSIINADPNLWHYGEDFNPAKILNIHEEFVKKYSEKVPLGRKAEVKEVSSAVVFLAADESSYITGQNIIVDGGWTAW